MDYDSEDLDILNVELKKTNDENKRLSEENAMLRYKLNRLTSEQKVKGQGYIDAMIKAIDLEKERDQMFENLEKNKKKYNKLHDAYLEKVKCCAAFENMFKRQKTSIEQGQKEQEMALANRLSTANTENLETKVTKLQTALDEAYDIIDELEFELESIDFLEMENQRLQNELASLKAAQHQKSIPTSGFHNRSFDALDGQVHDNNDGGDGDYEALLRYDPNDYAGAEKRYTMRHAVAPLDFKSTSDDADSATINRSALANSTVIRGAEAESHCSRRELLRSRLRNTVRLKATDTVEMK